MLRLLLLAALLPMMHLLPLPAAHGDLATAIDATCRITAQDGVRGTGCAFEHANGFVYVLTAGHVVGQGRVASCEFWRDGHQSNRFPGQVVRAVWNQQADAAILAIADQAFGGYVPAVVPLAPPGQTLQPKQTVTSVGCSQGSWATAWKGHLMPLENGDPDLRFIPPPKQGRSGSAIFNADGTQIVGILTARTMDNGQGVGTSLQTIYAVLGSGVGPQAVTRMVPVSHTILTQYAGGDCGGYFCPNGGCRNGRCPTLPARPAPATNNPNVPYPTLPAPVPSAPLGPPATLPLAPPANPTTTAATQAEMQSLHEDLAAVRKGITRVIELAEQAPKPAAAEEIAARIKIPEPKVVEKQVAVGPSAKDLAAALPKPVDPSALLERLVQRVERLPAKEDLPKAVAAETIINGVVQRLAEQKSQSGATVAVDIAERAVGVGWPALAGMLGFGTVPTLAVGWMLSRGLRRIGDRLVDRPGSGGPGYRPFPAAAAGDDFGA